MREHRYSLKTRFQHSRDHVKLLKKMENEETEGAACMKAVHTSRQAHASKIIMDNSGDCRMLFSPMNQLNAGPLSRINTVLIQYTLEVAEHKLCQLKMQCSNSV